MEGARKYEKANERCSLPLSKSNKNYLKQSVKDAGQVTANADMS